MSFRNYVNTLAEFFSNRFVSREALEAKQLDKFRRLVAFAKERSPYYQRLIRRSGIDVASCLPDDFPVLTKRDFIRHFDDIVTDRAVTRERIARFIDWSDRCDEMLDGKYYVVHSSGTSGQVSYGIFTQDEWDRGHLHFARIAPAFGLGVRRRIAFLGSLDGHVYGSLMARLNETGVRRILLKARRYDINDPIRPIIKDLNEFQPNMVGSYGGALNVLARFQEAGELTIAPKHLFYAGEPLNAEQRRYVARVFNADPKSIYASSEHLLMGATVAGSDLMQLFEDDLMFEFGADHLLVTNLFNYSTPLIRYRMDDALTPVGIKTTAHPFTLIETLIARQEKMLTFTNRHGRADFIHPSVALSIVVPDMRGVQIVLVDDRHFVFRVQIDPAASEATRAEVHRKIQGKLRAMLAQKEMDNVTFEIEDVDQFGVDPRTRKFKMIIQHGQSAEA